MSAHSARSLSPNSNCDGRDRDPVRSGRDGSTVTRLSRCATHLAESAHLQQRRLQVAHPALNAAPKPGTRVAWWG